MTASKLDFRTPNQIRKDQERERIVALYVAYRSAVQANGFRASDNQIFTRIASEKGLSTVTVRSICIGAGVATPKRVKIC